MIISKRQGCGMTVDAVLSGEFEVQVLHLLLQMNEHIFLSLFNIDSAPAFGYASPVAAKSATGFDGPNTDGGYRHCFIASGIFVSTARLLSGRPCGRLSSLPVSVGTGPSTRMVALFAFDGASGAFQTPNQRRTAMQNAPHLRLISGGKDQSPQQTPRSETITINSIRTLLETANPSGKLIRAEAGQMRLILAELLRDFDYHAGDPYACRSLLNNLMVDLETYRYTHGKE